MGGHSSKAESLQYDPKDWHQTERSVFYEVMQNNRGEQAQLYHFNIKADREIDDQAELYHRRKSTSANIVKILGANITSSGFGFCGTQENACVLTERIPTLLNSVSRLGRQQSAVVLYNAIKGFAEASKIVVPNAITDKMIGLNKLGQVKVWVSENFGMNHPGNHATDLHLDESLVLTNLVKAISSKLDFNGEFNNGVVSSRSFVNALNFIRTNSGVAENVLESNRVNLQAPRQQQVPVLNSGVQLPGQTLSGIQRPQVYVPPQQTTGYTYINTSQPQRVLSTPNYSVNTGYTPIPQYVMQPNQVFNYQQRV